MADAERDRRDGADAAAWRRWGPYLSERAWGTVREDYSVDGSAWDFFPHDHARSRAYRWNEDGLAGLCDDQQRLCFSLSFWNGADPILKERIFGLTGSQGNHGEDAKEYWWYVDSTPTHSWMRWRYVYPQTAYPYDELVAVNGARSREDYEYELLDTGVFEGNRYFDVVVDYAKASANDICIRVRVTNAGPEPATLHLLPTLWFRDTWSWDPGAPVPVLAAGPAGSLLARHPDLPEMVLAADGAPTPLFCDNATNNERLWGTPGPAFAKDGINDHVVSGAATVNPALTGTKAALRHELTVGAGQTVEVRLRLAPTTPAGATAPAAPPAPAAPAAPAADRVAPAPAAAPDLHSGWEGVLAAREAEADEFYAGVCAGATPAESHVIRSAFAGMLWSKQYYAYAVREWLAGDPGQPVPPPQRWQGRNSRWQTLDIHDVVSMPDTWEYPWFAAWDLAFHCVTLARVDPAFAKAQLGMVLGDGWMHPTGQVPAYEWDFGAVNPPVHAWAALRVFRADGSRDTGWLRQVFQRLLVNFTWWVTKNDPEGFGVFGGGFLGMDNIGPFDRNTVLPPGYALEQADATGWMGLFCVSMLEIAAVLAAEDPTLEDMALMFFEDFVLIARAAQDAGLWHDDDGFYYDQLVDDADGARWPVAVRSMSGLVPLFSVITLSPELLAGLPRVVARAQRFLTDHPGAAAASDVSLGTGSGPAASAGRPGLLALVDRGRLAWVLRTVGDTAELLSPHGIRSVSAVYRDSGYVFHGGAQDDTRIDYEPAESTTPLFGGNSNWRGPVWLPVNYLLLQALRRYAEAVGDDLVVEYPHGSGTERTLSAVADDLSDRLTGLYLPDADGNRPVWGGTERFREDPSWRDSLLFFEYFHGDNGAGLGASHQTGWTGLVADLLLERVRARGSVA